MPPVSSVSRHPSEQDDDVVIDLTTSPTIPSRSRSRKRSAAHISTTASSSNPTRERRSVGSQTTPLPSDPAQAAPGAAPAVVPATTAPTQSSSSSSSSATATTSHAGPSTKRRRTDHDRQRRSSNNNNNNNTQDRSDAPRLQPEASIEEINLVDDDDPLSTTLQRQREEQIREQQSGPQRQDGSEGSKLNALTCAICLEQPTDLTATSCGHLFCHECLFSSLVAGERATNGDSRKSTCPICRKTISRKKTNDVIPLAMMTRGVMKGKRQPLTAQGASVA